MPEGLWSELAPFRPQFVEMCLIRTKQRRIDEQPERLEQQLADIRRFDIDPQAVEIGWHRGRLQLSPMTGDSSWKPPALR